MRYNSKEALIDDIVAEHDLLSALLGEIPPHEQLAPGVWGNGWNIRDLVAHLGEWQRMFLGWYRTGKRGGKPAMPAAGYKWNETPRLNRDIWEKHRSSDPKRTRAQFESAYRQIVRLVRALSTEQLFEAGHFAWTGRNSLTTYLGANTASHYRFAIKAINRWQRRTGRSGEARSA
jgi:hypothetical protein